MDLLVLVDGRKPEYLPPSRDRESEGFERTNFQTTVNVTVQ